MTLTFRGQTQMILENGLREFVEANVLIDHAELVRGLDRLAVEIHNDNVAAGWWTDLASGEPTLHTRNRGEMLMLCVSELSEAEEAGDKGLRDDKLPEHFGLHVEIADTVIRLLDLIGAEQKRGGHQPLVTYRQDLPNVSVASCYQDYMNDCRCLRGNLMVIVNDLSRALEAYRKDQVRLARYWLTTALFRCIAFSVLEDIDLFEIIEAKREFNRNRADHKIENRMAPGGKKC